VQPSQMCRLQGIHKRLISSASLIHGATSKIYISAVPACNRLDEIKHCWWTCGRNVWKQVFYYNVVQQMLILSRKQFHICFCIKV